MSEQEQEQQQTQNEKYDDGASNIFIIAVVGIILVIWTYFYFKKFQKWNKPSKHTHYCGCTGCQKKETKTLENQKFFGSFFDWIKLSIYLLLWMFLLLTILKAYNVGFGEQTAVFDPYAILELEYGASESDIKKAARRLKLENHPDKNPGNEEKFILIRKAEETLTDPGTREKWELYGNPDGPQRTSIGMALPEFLADQQNANFILALYVLGLVVLFPLGVYYWQKSYAEDDIVVSRETQELYTKITSTATFQNLLNLLSASREYYDNIPVRDLDQKVIKELTSLNSSFDQKKKPPKNSKQQQNNQTPEYIQKNQQLFYSHFGRLYNVLNEDLKKDLDFLVGQSPILCAVLAETSLLKYRYALPAIHSLEMCAMLTQAVWSSNTRLKVKDTSFLQLPHITQEFVDSLQNPKNKSSLKIKTLQEFYELGPEKRLQYLNNYSKDQINDIEKVLNILPIDLKWTTKVAVDDDKEPDITPGSLVTIFVTASRPSHPTPQWTLDEREKLKKKNNLNSPQNIGDPISVHCPFFPKEKKEIWWLILGNEKTGLSSNIMRHSSLTDKTEIQMKFRAPDKIGSYQLTLWILSDSYVGFNEKLTLKFNVVKESTIKLDEKEKKNIKDEDDENGLLSEDDIDMDSDVNSDEISDSEEE